MEFEARLLTSIDLCATEIAIDFIVREFSFDISTVAALRRVGNCFSRLATGPCPDFGPASTSITDSIGCLASSCPYEIL